MKRWLLLGVFLLIVGIITGCSTKTESTSKSTEVTQAKKQNETKNYGVNKIIVPVETQWLKGVQAYQDYNLAVLKEIAKNSNVELQLEEIPTFEDSVKAVKRGDADVVLGASNSNSEELSQTYSYLSTALYFPDGTQVVLPKDYIMLVQGQNEKLLNLLNDGIRNLQKSGKLDSLEEQYLGDREDKEHMTLDEVTSYDHISSLTSEERTDLQNRLAEYKENKE